MGKFRGMIVVDRERCKGCNLCGGLSAPYISAHGETSKQKRVSLCRTGPEGFVQRMCILRRGVPGRMHYRV